MAMGIGFRGFAAIFVACMALMGCKNVKDDGGASVSDPNSGAGAMNDPLKELVNVAVEARDELRLLAKTRDGIATKSMTIDQHRQRQFQAMAVPDGFSQRVSFHYVGEAEKAAEGIAKLADYKLEVIGQRSRTPIVVEINIDDQPLNEALRELGEQTGDSVMVEVWGSKKMMRFVYKGVM